MIEVQRPDCVLGLVQQGLALQQHLPGLHLLGDVAEVHRQAAVGGERLCLHPDAQWLVEVRHHDRGLLDDGPLVGSRE